MEEYIDNSKFAARMPTYWYYDDKGGLWVAPKKKGRPVVQQLSTSPLGSRGPAEPQLDPRPCHGVLRIRDGRTGPAHYPSDVPRTQNAGDSKAFRFMKPGLIFHVGHLNEGNPNADFMMIIAGESEKILVCEKLTPFLDKP